MPFSVPDHDIKVHYYLVNPDSKLHNACTNYWSAAEHFAEKAEAAVKKIGADSAIKTLSFDMKIEHVCFLPGSAPLTGWEKDGFGSYKPTSHKNKAILSDIIIPYFRFDDMRDLRFAKLGDVIIAAHPPGQDSGAPRSIAGATLISDEEVARYKAAAPEKDVKHFSMDRYYWTASPIAHSPAFIRSEAVNAEMERHREAHFRNFGRRLSPAFEESVLDRIGKALRSLTRRAPPAAASKKDANLDA